MNLGFRFHISYSYFIFISCICIFYVNGEIESPTPVIDDSMLNLSLEWHGSCNSNNRALLIINKYYYVNLFFCGIELACMQILCQIFYGL